MVSIKIRDELLDGSWTEVAAYMACIRAVRVRKGCCVPVYGVLTDGKDFEFLKLGRKGGLKKTERMDLLFHSEAVFGYLGRCFEGGVVKGGGDGTERGGGGGED